MKYTGIICCLFVLTGCGLQRDLVLPGNDKHAKNSTPQTDTTSTPATTPAAITPVTPAVAPATTPAATQ